MTSKERQKGSIVNSFLNSVEKIGNKLPIQVYYSF